MEHKTATSNIKECFTEYSLEDKVEALKNTLSYNEKHGKIESLHTDKICNMKKTIGVKECLQINEETPFQTLISELRNTVMNSYWNKEIGKTRYQVPNLPIGLNPLETTFGKKIKSDISAAGVPSNVTGDKTTAYSLIFPNIFTRYGLSNLDLSKARSKEEIKNIFEKIGVQFPNDNFDLVWEEELKKSGKDTLSIETFRNLFDQHNY